MSAYATKVAEGFSQRLLLEMYERSLTDAIVNRDYEGEINDVGSTLNILNFDRISEKDYDGSNLTVDDLYENNAQLVIDQQKSFYWREKTIDKWKSYIKNPNPTVMKQKADERNKNMDEYVLGLYGDVWAGNRVGTDYTTGTVTIDASGNVTGAGTTFTSAMEGRGFKADGHTTWYRVKTFTNATTIVIEDDLDDVSSTYSGGTIDAGSSYTIQAASTVQVTTSNLVQKVAQLKLRLDQAESYSLSAVPDEDRILVVPPEFETVLVDSGAKLHVPEAYTDLIKRGAIHMMQGFLIMKSTRLTGDNTDGYRVLATQKNWCTFADKLLEVGIEDLIGNFGKAYKDLFVYGAKVTDSRRQFAAEGYFTFDA